MSESVLELQGLGKRYRAYGEPVDRMKHLLGFRYKADEHWALQDVSFTLRRGQCLGVVGDNGAGKSTLLKLLAGTLQPSHGRLHRVGRLTAILELGAGFHPEFSGYENLLHAGSFIGISQADMAGLADGIIAFAELGDAIQRPVKTYSSGMVVRLAFALVTAVPPDILIIDEALAVGDQQFQKKCIARIESFRRAQCTVLFCSHSLYHVRQLCDSVLWLDRGKVAGLGDTDTVLANYEVHVRQQMGEGLPQPTLADQHKSIVPLALPSDRKAALSHVEVKGLEAGHGPGGVARLRGEDLQMTIQAITADHEQPSIGMMIEQFEGVGVTSVASHAEGVSLTKLDSAGNSITWQTTLTFTGLPLHSGRYVLSFYLFDAQGLVVFDEWKNHIQFDWSSPSLTPGLVRLPHIWS